MLNTTIGRFRLIGFIEGLSFILLLFIAMPLKYLAGFPQAVQIIGMAHGILFIVYVFLAIQCKFLYDWTYKKFMILFLASLIPFGTFYTDSKFLRFEKVNE